MKGRPKGSYTRPQIKDYIKFDDIKILTAKAVSKAKSGDIVMLKFVLEQIYGKAAQTVEVPGGLNLNVKFDETFNSPLKTKGDNSKPEKI